VRLTRSWLETWVFEAFPILQESPSPFRYG
jgi:hypothetical protein